jgi:hypothetical protein
MISVAIMGLVLGGWRVRERYRHYALKAAECEAEGRSLAHEAEKVGRTAEIPADPADPLALRRQEEHRTVAEGYRSRAAYYSAMGAKYRRAASRPWLPVEPDPPPP